MHMEFRSYIVVHDPYRILPLLLYTSYIEFTAEKKCNF